MRTLIPLLAVVISVCCAADSVSVPTPKVEQILSIQRTRSALLGVETVRNGFWVELKTFEHGSFTVRHVIITEYENGERVHSACLAYDYADEFLRELDAIGLEQFDFEKEVATIEDQATARGEKIYKPDVLDGVEHEICYRRKSAEICFRRMNLGLQVDFYAAHSKNIAKLKAVLDLLARFWGRHELGV